MDMGRRFIGNHVLSNEVVDFVPPNKPTLYGLVGLLEVHYQSFKT